MCTTANNFAFFFFAGAAAGASAATASVATAALAAGALEAFAFGAAALTPLSAPCRSHGGILPDVCPSAIRGFSTCYGVERRYNNSNALLVLLPG